MLNMYCTGNSLKIEFC